MDTLWTVIWMMKPYCYMASIYIKDAYYSVPKAKTDQKYLTFEWQENCTNVHVHKWFNIVPKKVYKTAQACLLLP